MTFTYKKSHTPTLHSFLKESFKDRFNQRELDLLPHGCTRTGHVIIIRLEDVFFDLRTEIGNAFLNYFPRQRTVALQLGPTSGIIRTPKFEIIAGEKSSETIHKELGCKFRLDPLKLTFSAGNHNERVRMIEITNDGENVLDMFACVGNLSIPLCVHRNIECIGIEINPLAFNYLNETVELNNLNNRYKAFLGDNRLHSPINFADRVLMGYWGIDEKQRESAILALNEEKGGWIHYHESIPRKSKPNANKLITQILNQTKNNFEIIYSKEKKIKWVSQSHAHYVTDIHLIPA